MGLSCALPTSLSEVISTQLIKKKNDNNKAKGLKQRGPVITTTNNFPKDTVKPTGQRIWATARPSHKILAATGYLIAMTVLVYYVWNAHHHLDDRIEESVSTLMTDCVRSYAKKTRRSDCPRGVCPSDHWPHVSSVGSIILVPRLPFFPSIGNAMRFSHNLLNHD
jgi:hypothetical protein